MRGVLITGFGPFPGVPDNPTAALARAMDGRTIAGRRVFGEVLPVSFRRGPDRTIHRARELGVGLVVGLGVATSRSEVCVEARAVRVEASGPDVDGSGDPQLIGPDVVAATLDVEGFTVALGARRSDDAGEYVCNAWLYRVASALTVPVGFVHVPPEGLDPDRLAHGIAALWTDGTR